MAETWTKSSWANLESGIATKVFTRLPFSSKLMCESVCTAWRQLLREQPAQGVWGSRLILTDTDKSLPTPCGPREDDSIIRLPAMSGLLLEEQIMSLCKWLKQRATGIPLISIGSFYREMQLDTVTQATVVHEVLGKLCQMQAIPNIEIYIGTKGDSSKLGMRDQQDCLGQSAQICIHCRVLLSKPLFAAKPFGSEVQSCARCPPNIRTATPGSCCPLKFDISQPDFDITPSCSVRKA